MSWLLATSATLIIIVSPEFMVRLMVLPSKKVSVRDRMQFAGGSPEFAVVACAPRACKRGRRTLRYQKYGGREREGNPIGLDGLSRASPFSSLQHINVSSSLYNGPGQFRFGPTYLGP